MGEAFSRIALAAGIFGFALSSSAQVTAHIGAGLGIPVGGLAGERQLGAGVSAGGGYNFGPRFSVMLDFASISLTVSPSLQNVLPFTSDTIWSFSVDPYYRFMTGHRFQPYISGGYGVYSVHSELTEKSVLKGGVNAGAGLGLQIGENSSIYFEARVSNIWVAGRNVTIVPFTVGFRWR